MRTLVLTQDLLTAPRSHARPARPGGRQQHGTTRSRSSATASLVNRPALELAAGGLLLLSHVPASGSYQRRRHGLLPAAKTFLPKLRLAPTMPTHQPLDNTHTSGRRTQEATRTTPKRAPNDKSFWIESTSGAGSVAPDWRPRPGRWRAVLVNADGARGITARLRFGARASLLWSVGAALLGLGIIAAARAATLFRSARR